MDRSLIEWIKKLHLSGLSIRQIAKATGLSKSTIHRYLKDGKAEKKEFTDRQIWEMLGRSLRKRIRELLLFTTEEKGRSRPLSYSQIYQILERELHPNITKARFVKFMNFFVRKTWGSLEKLEEKRRSFKERAKYQTSKGSLKREEKAWWEVDATGYTFKGVQYSILQAVDRLTGFVFPALILPNKSKNAKHYNKAFTSLDVAVYLKKLFETYGRPARLITDNEAILTSELIKRGLKTLGIEIQRTIPGRPQQKIIERVFRELKANAREVLADPYEKTPEMKELWARAVHLWNFRPHEFKHTGKAVPFELAQEYGVAVEEVEQELLEFAFAERFERKVINNAISIDGMLYEFVYPYENAELGRKTEFPSVVAYRKIDNVEELIVCSEAGKFLGTARLITKPHSTSTREDKQIRRELKRIEKRTQKLEEERLELLRRKEELTSEKQGNRMVVEVVGFLELAHEGTQEEALETKSGKKLELDFIKLFAKEGDDEDACLQDNRKLH